MDPITVLTLATTAFTGIKKVVQAGKDAEDIYRQLSKWAGHVSDLHECIKDHEPKKPGMFEKIGFSKNETSEAFDQIIAKRKIDEMEKEIRHMFTWGELHHLGLDGYKDFIKRRRKIKAEREKMIYEQMRRKKKFLNIVKQSIIAGVLIIFTVWFMWWAIDFIMSAPAFQSKDEI
tara:strand:+ start:4361 stop:4885 length:525 start_codon:yes stop_codon:yes gene_type:complete